MTQRTRGQAIAALLIAMVIPALAPAGQEAPQIPGIIDALRRIQTTCFDLYPQKLLRRMAGSAGPIPEESRADPRQQVNYLKTEEKVAKGLFYPSILEDILPAFEAVLRPGTRFLDLGSGDGRVVFMAALLGAQASGVEYDRALHHLALKARHRLVDLIDPSRARLKRGDFFKEDLRPYDAFFYYALGSSHEQELLTTLRRQMSDTAVLILAYPSGPVPGFLKIADYAGVDLFKRESD